MLNDVLKDFGICYAALDRIRDALERLSEAASEVPEIDPNAPAEYIKGFTDAWNIIVDWVQRGP